MLCRKSHRSFRAESVPVFLNVYDLTPINDYAYWFGLGVYHSGVQGPSYSSSTFLSPPFSIHINLNLARNKFTDLKTVHNAKLNRIEDFKIYSL